MIVNNRVGRFCGKTNCLLFSKNLLLLVSVKPPCRGLTDPHPGPGPLALNCFHAAESTKRRMEGASAEFKNLSNEARRRLPALAVTHMFIQSNALQHDAEQDTDVHESDKGGPRVCTRETCLKSLPHTNARLCLRVRQPVITSCIGTI